MIYYILHVYPVSVKIDGDVGMQRIVWLLFSSWNMRKAGFADMPYTCTCICMHVHAGDTAIDLATTDRELQIATMVELCLTDKMHPACKWYM